jgi:hypothetical protein
MNVLVYIPNSNLAAISLPSTTSAEAANAKSKSLDKLILAVNRIIKSEEVESLTFCCVRCGKVDEESGNPQAFDDGLMI